MFKRMMERYNGLEKTAKQKVQVIGACALILIASILVVINIPEAKPTIVQDLELPPEFVILVAEPKNEDELLFVAALSSIQSWNGKYQPMFIMQNSTLDAHQALTLAQIGMLNTPKLLFTNDDNLFTTISSQFSNVVKYQMKTDIFARYKGFKGTITVASYEEALWVAPLAVKENKVIVKGERSFKTQEEVWERLLTKHNLRAEYVLVTNPNDYKDLGKYHYPTMSAVAAEIAAKRNAYVMTNWSEVVDPSIVDLAGNQTLVEINKKAVGMLVALRALSKSHGPIKNICIVGSAEAVPQMELPDHSESEGDFITSSDSIFGFLDEDDYTMDAAVGRIINYNVAGASNMIVRTYMYDKFVKNVDVKYSNGGVKSIEWRKHGAAIGGYQITYQRGQTSPPRFLKDDMEDEGLVCELYGPSAFGFPFNTGSGTVEFELNSALQASGFVGYRGHGSWHGSFYMWGAMSPNADPESYDKLEGTECRELFFPPQVVMIAACECAKIHGLSYSGTETSTDRFFAPNYLYGGAIGFIGATEVSYSDLFQDITAYTGLITGDHDWDKNNAVFAFVWDGLLDHEKEHGSLGEAHRWMINRYIKTHGSTITPLKQEGEGSDWKEVSMYALYGDPAFVPAASRPGANNYDPWHNGADDM
ncbi:MAG: C25 family cysteine peptidase [Thermoplasmata archaeon]